MAENDLEVLEREIGKILKIADQFGLEYYPMRYEICPADIIYTIAAYGMPTRFSHWSFGKAFHKMRLHYDFNVNRIYELVINSNPCHAFLLEDNSLIQNKLVCAHVLGHSDFFKNNQRFCNTSRDMIESMSVAAERFRQYEMEFGTDIVEQTLDAVTALQEHVDASLFCHVSGKKGLQSADIQPAKQTPYDDLWDLDHRAVKGEGEGLSLGKQGDTIHSAIQSNLFRKVSEKDLLQFIMKYSKVLAGWQRDIVSTLREEMLYFWPQIETKIMNEGWASYWHIKILREMDLAQDEAIEFAKLNAQVLQPSQTNINPYYLGLKIFEDIANKHGEKAIFDVRELDSDQSFLRNYLTKELVEQLDLYVFAKLGLKWKITDTQWEVVRNHLVESRTNGGFPVLIVKDGDYKGNGELYIEHRYEGVELDIKYLEKTMPYVYHLWGRNVHIQTVMEKRKVTFMYDGNKVYRRFS